MRRFECDYATGAHPKVLEALIQTNPEACPGYGTDDHCAHAAQLIRELCRAPQADVHFLVGGTQTNMTVIAAALRPHQGVISTAMGHINDHETGAVEATGHKVLPVPSEDGKLTAEQVEADRADANLGHERDAVNTALSHMEELGISGGLIRAGGQVVAFSLGSLTTADCYNVHFEKAYGEIQGAYAVINREMARWVRSTFPQVAYLNREDDMGLEGLRKAKLSYYPDILLKKYSAREV